MMAPSDGAMMGTSTNTPMMYDMVLAISSPWRVSRMMANATTRPPAAPNPQTKRATSMNPNEGANADPMAPIM